MTKLILQGLFLLVASTFASTVQSGIVQAKPLSVAHRGASNDAPENTIASFKLAIELGADFLEIDLQQTSDREIVIVHDQKVDRTTNGKGRVKDLTLAQIKTLDAGSWFGSNFKDERVPTLIEVLDLLKALAPEVLQKTRLVLEFKAGNTVYPGIEERTINLVRQSGLEKYVIYKSFRPKILKRIRVLAPHVPQIYVFIASAPGLAFTLDPLPNFINPLRMNVEYLQPKAQLLTENFVKRAHRKGYKIIAWDAQTPELVAKMKSYGVDAIENNDPGLVRE